MTIQYLSICPLTEGPREGIRIMRKVQRPYVAFRHPVTGGSVVVREETDYELTCLELGGHRQKVGEKAWARLVELSQQGAAVRARIVKKCLGEDELSMGVAA